RVQPRRPRERWQGTLMAAVTPAVTPRSWFVRSGGSCAQDLCEALPPLRPAALCWAVVPPCLLLPLPLCDFWPPCSDALGELAILAARSFDMPLSFSASYWSLFFTLADFDGIDAPFGSVGGQRCPRARASSSRP